MNQFKYSLDNKRYHTYNYYLKNKYHQKVAKVALNADFTCPNRDGTKGYGGCIFCSSSGSGDYAGNVHDHLEKQFQTISQVMKRKWPECAYIAYFQANTNTYGPLDKIKKMIAPFLNKEDVKGIALATRPDCLNEEIVQYLSTINKQKDVYIELGLQTIHEQTSKLINRGHTFQEFLDGLALCRKYNLEVCVHIINGLPFETKEMMIETAKKNKIPYQLEIMTDGGTDAGAIHLTRAGIKTGGISVPTRYVHSPSEMASVSDIENSVKLLYNIAIAQW